MKQNTRNLKIIAFVALTVPLWTACAQTSASDKPSGGSTGGGSPAPVEVRLEPVVTGLNQPLDFVNASDGSGRLFIVEKGGTVRILQDGELAAEPFLDIGDKVTSNSERGLLGRAFAPNYADTGLFYINYTDLNGDTVVAEYKSSDPATADPASETILLTIPQPEPNHNGGDLAFGPDGMLYIGTGDGGGGGDQHGAIGNGQNLDTLLGKLLRIQVGTEVGAGSSYTVPTDNPFVSTEGARPEIWAYGLRNPWRFSFDAQTGDLYIGDVGQNVYEEIDFQAANSPGGENYGWRVMEGFHCYNANNCDQTSLTLPVLEYPHSEGNSVTGGYVYRGDALPDLVGQYIYGDFGSGRIWRAQKQGDAWTNELLLESGLNIASFGEDEAGELYAVAIGGGVYRLTK
ncbi:PQQ-dependent sugar dehydrogenase [soil metagenome]